MVVFSSSLKGEAIKMSLAFVSSGIRTIWLNMERYGKMPCLVNSRKVWLLGCPSHLFILHVTWWYHLIPNSSHKHHWSITSILEYISLGNCPTLKSHTGRWVECKYYAASTWWKWRFDFQIRLSRFCIAARVMALWREIWGEIRVVEWIRQVNNIMIMIITAEICLYSAGKLFWVGDLVCIICLVWPATAHDSALVLYGML